MTEILCFEENGDLNIGPENKRVLTFLTSLNFSLKNIHHRYLI
jgi:hypothetical protein